MGRAGALAVTKPEGIDQFLERDAVKKLAAEIELPAAKADGGRRDYVVYAFFRADGDRSGEVVYIGMGIPSRPYAHLRVAKSDEPLRPVWNRKLIAMIRRATRNGAAEPQPLILRSGLAVDQAKEMEKRLISLIGRQMTKDGPLYNIREGGDGAASPLAIKRSMEVREAGGWEALKRGSARGRATQAASGYQNLKNTPEAMETGRKKGRETMRERGFTNLRQGIETQRALGFPGQRKGIETARVGGFQNLVKGRKRSVEANRAQGFKNLEKGRNAQKEAGYQNLKKGIETLKANGYAHLKAIHENQRAEGFPNLKSAALNRARNARANRQARRAAAIGATPDQIVWLVARWRDPAIGCSLPCTKSTENKLIREHDLADEALRSEVELAIVACR